MHAPLTIKSIWAPFWPAEMSAWTSTGSVREFIFATILAGKPLAAAAPTASIFSTMFFCRKNGAAHNLFILPKRLGLARWTNKVSMSAVMRTSLVR